MNTLEIYTSIKNADFYINKRYCSPHDNIKDCIRKNNDDILKKRDELTKTSTRKIFVTIAFIPAVSIILLIASLLAKQMNTTWLSILTGLILISQIAFIIYSYRKFIKTDKEYEAENAKLLRFYQIIDTIDTYKNMESTIEDIVIIKNGIIINFNDEKEPYIFKDEMLKYIRCTKEWLSDLDDILIVATNNDEKYELGIF